MRVCYNFISGYSRLKSSLHISATHPFFQSLKSGPAKFVKASLSLSKLEQLRLHQRRQWSLRFCWTPYLFAPNGTVLGSYTRSNWSKSCHESS
ncbi:hypothetical protein ACFXTO_006504 [Malus domestica]